MTDAAVTDADMTDDLIEARNKRDRQRLQRVARKHGAIVLAALTLWGAADAWASSTGWLLAETIALLNAIFAATVVAYIAHEWGHFAGARMSGAVSPVLKEPISFFMFNFRHELNTRGQFLTMSMGGPAANWLLAIALLALLPVMTWSQALLVATALGIAVSVSVFEFPVIRRVMYGEAPQEVLDQRLQETGSRPRYIGIAVAALAWLVLI